jgi:hypothetical protein
MKWTNGCLFITSKRKDDQDENRQELLKEDKAMMKKIGGVNCKTSFN